MVLAIGGIKMLFTDIAIKSLMFLKHRRKFGRSVATLLLGKFKIILVGQLIFKKKNMGKDTSTYAKLELIILHAKKLKKQDIKSD